MFHVCGSCGHDQTNHFETSWSFYLHSGLKNKGHTISLTSSQRLPYSLTAYSLPIFFLSLIKFYFLLSILKEYVILKKKFMYIRWEKVFRWIWTVEDRLEDTLLKLLLSSRGKFSNLMGFAYPGTLEKLIHTLYIFLIKCLYVVLCACSYIFSFKKFTFN